ncbi:uncharacterized protein LOC132902591 isoform X2 [Amyelois transitella]|uniref:uncharacterized protein LOC132902591 isoform X2 n=1 Tax=Amyelois transitella TaxID=680683 RepID=UPI0029905E5C|nr:uncharacterized protein LOC132902591 isoform X2 [Amyelois transitella]
MAATPVGPPLPSPVFQPDPFRVARSVMSADEAAQPAAWRRRTRASRLTARRVVVRALTSPLDNGRRRPPRPPACEPDIAELSLSSNRYQSECLTRRRSHVSLSTSTVEIGCVSTLCSSVYHGDSVLFQ